MSNPTVEIQPIRIEFEPEEDGRIFTSVPGPPGVIAHGGAEAESIRKGRSIALQVLADKIETGEEVPAGQLHVLLPPQRRRWTRRPG